LVIVLILFILFLVFLKTRTYESFFQFKSLKTISDLHRQYETIFKISGNRNAASHRWAKFIIDNSEQMDENTLLNMFKGFCPVSGSPVSEGREPLTIELDKLNGQKIKGDIYYCCWPCFCDTKDFIKVDTKTIKTKNGSKQYNFLVIGDPCTDPKQIPFSSTPELQCSNGKITPGKLLNTYRSDNGHIIIGLLHNSDKSKNLELEKKCIERKNTGFQSGMGDIFRTVADVNKI
jgi:hypothetical protein